MPPNSGLQPTRSAAFLSRKLCHHRVADRAAEPWSVRRRMQVAADVIFFWLPMAAGVATVVWAVVLVRRADTRTARAASLLAAATIVCLSGWSLWALLGIRFANMWPIFLPYLLVSLACVGTFIFHLATRKTVV
jgi:hypothetical protein